MTTISAFAYLLSAVCFVFALKGLSAPKSARNGNLIGMIGMAIAVVVTFVQPTVQTYGMIIAGIIVGGVIGAVIAAKIKMTDMPQLIAAFHSLVGLAATLIAAAALYDPSSYGIGTKGNIHTGSLVEMGLGALIGAITFTGSIVAFCKLQGIGSSAPLVFKGQHAVNAALALLIIGLLVTFCATESHVAFWFMVVASFALGYLLIVPIGGADMPVVVSMLNSYSGWAASGIGFTLGNSLLIITGALVGASGAILSYIMCKAMNRSLINVIFGGFGSEEGTVPGAGAGEEQKPVQAGSAEDAAYLMGNAESVIIVPGYGMAVAQAQHALREMGDILSEKGIKVSYAIHPVAGRMPGHMNVLLAEANVSYDEVFELDEINTEFKETEVVYVIGANDVTNPAAKTDKTSAIYGMPILDVEDAQHVLFVKRGMAAGFAGVQNELFFRDNTMMLFADAKKMTEGIVKSLKALD